MKDFFVIGGGSLQVEFIKTLKHKGYITHVFDYNPECPGRQFADYFYEISIDDKEHIYQIAKEINPIGVQTVATELGNITASWVGEKLGTNNNTYQVALNTTDKCRMKEIFKLNNIPSAKSMVLTDIQPNLADIDLTFPLVVKASDRSAGRGIRLAYSEADFYMAYNEARDESNNKRVIIEEYIEGRQFSIETISSRGKHYIVGITEETVDGIPNFVESSHILPADIPPPFLKDLKQLIYRLLDIFCIQYGAAHIELKHNNNGFYIIELASRMGGWRDDLIRIASGVDYLALIIDSVTNKAIDINPIKQNYAIVKTILNKKDYERYIYLKSNYPNNIVKEDIHYNNDNFQAINLMQSQGLYFLESNTKDLANEFFKRY